ncbi:VanZ family protein [Dactylosporangium sp. CA-233914]|uniref:VanZ family protein n=1 Tax=Dactylosporangium sp. CA-233914 TaxID=3239934 RepID=UPI003D8EA949
MPDSGGPWTLSLVLMPFRGYEAEDAVMNMLVFLPLGMLIPLLLARPSWWKALGTVAAASLTIELSQLAVQGLSAGGHIADINDLTFNTVGGALGYGLFQLLTLIPGVPAIIDRFRLTAKSG